MKTPEQLAEEVSKIQTFMLLANVALKQQQFSNPKEPSSDEDVFLRWMIATNKEQELMRISEEFGNINIPKKDDVFDLLLNGDKGTLTNFLSDAKNAEVFAWLETNLPKLKQLQHLYTNYRGNIEIETLKKASIFKPTETQAPTPAPAADLPTIVADLYGHLSIKFSDDNLNEMRIKLKNTLMLTEAEPENRDQVILTIKEQLKTLLDALRNAPEYQTTASELRRLSKQLEQITQAQQLQNPKVGK